MGSTHHYVHQCYSRLFKASKVTSTSQSFVCVFDKIETIIDIDIATAAYTEVVIRIMSNTKVTSLENLVFSARRCQRFVVHLQLPVSNMDKGEHDTAVSKSGWRMLAFSEL